MKKISEESCNDPSFQGLWYPSILEDWHEGFPITTILASLSFYKCIRVEGMNSQCKLEQKWDFKEIHVEIVYFHGSVRTLSSGLASFSL